MSITDDIGQVLNHQVHELDAILQVYSGIAPSTIDRVLAIRHQLNSIAQTLAANAKPSIAGETTDAINSLAEDLKSVVAKNENPRLAQDLRISGTAISTFLMSRGLRYVR